MLFKALIVAVVLLLGPVDATPCVGFDTNDGLYVFGLAHDVSLGPSSGWNANREWPDVVLTLMLKTLYSLTRDNIDKNRTPVCYLLVYTASYMDS
jgi:hypothetical protein